MSGLDLFAAYNQGLGAVPSGADLTTSLDALKLDEPLHERVCRICDVLVRKVLAHWASADRARPLKGTHQPGWSDVREAADRGCYFCSSVYTSAVTYQYDQELSDADFDRLYTTFTTFVMPQNSGLSTSLLLSAAWKKKPQLESQGERRQMQQGRNVIIFANFPFFQLTEAPSQGKHYFA